MNKDALWASITKLPPVAPPAVGAAVSSTPQSSPPNPEATKPISPPRFVIPSTASVPADISVPTTETKPSGDMTALPMMAEPAPQSTILPVPAPNPLKRFSLQGHGVEVALRAQEQKPLLGNICLSGQATVWFAPPNTGKTMLFLHLIMAAITDKRIAGGNVFYINADDSSAGLATKLNILEEFGVHILAEGHQGFKAKVFAAEMEKMIGQDLARGQFIILDTLKKFVSVMDKKASADFANLIRRFVLKGGTILCLAHTNKRPDADGKPIYGGTSDIVDDFDCSYIMSAVKSDDAPNERTILFENHKRRGDVAQQAFYTYATGDGLSYEELLASVRPADPNSFEVAGGKAGPPDAELIEAVKDFVKHGVTTKMKLADGVAKMTQASKRNALRVIEKYTGEDPSRHHWTYAVQARGAKVFVLLPPVEPESAEVIAPTG